MTLHRSTSIPAPEFSHRETKEPVPPQGTLERLLLRTEQTGWSVVYSGGWRRAAKRSPSSQVLHICRRLAASWDKLDGLCAQGSWWLRSELTTIKVRSPSQSSSKVSSTV